VECQLEALRKCLTVSSVRFALRNLPPTLDKTYERILNNIPQEYREEAHRALQLLAVSLRPLTLEEVAETIAVSPETDLFDPDHRLRDPEALLEICSSLLTLSKYGISVAVANHFSYELRFAHYSVKEYLTSSRILQGSSSDFAVVEIQAHRLVARMLMIYMLSVIAMEGSLQDDYGYLPDLDDLKEMFPLLYYASRFWSDHLHRAEVGNFREPEYSLVKQLFDPAFHYTFYQIWSNSMDTQLEYYANRVSAFDDITSEAAYRMYHASFLGLTQVVQWLLQQGADVNAASGAGYCYPLSAAAAAGHEAIVRLLLNFGAEIEASDKYSRTALYQAVTWDHEAVVALLLHRGACPEGLYNGSYGFEDIDSPLQVAARNLNEPVMRMLIEAGADVNAKSWCGNPLHFVAQGGDRKIVQLLLENGADLNVEGGLYGFPLHWAVHFGNEEMVRLLLEKGADINAEGGEHGYVQAAARGGNQN